jgi:guanylate kinase
MTLITNLKPEIIVLTSTSGGGKTTHKNILLNSVRGLEFSISCTSREKRAGEIHGGHYWFISEEEFKRKVKQKEFIEQEEVYPGKFYGTPYSEIERITNRGNHVLLDVDVFGAVSIKNKYPDTKIIFIRPRSLSVVEERLTKRKDTPLKDIKVRLDKAPKELEFAEKMVAESIFDVSLINDDLATAQKTIVNIVKMFLGQSKTADAALVRL